LVFEEEDKKKAIEEFRKVLHTVIDKRRKALKGYQNGKTEYLATEKDTFDTLVKLYRVVNKAEVIVDTVIDKGGKEETNVKITYPPKITQRILEEEIGT
jgi:transcription elongation factor GreA-like protein